MSFEYKREIDKDAIEAYLSTCDPDTKIYLGCDSKVYKHRKTKQVWIDYVSVVIIHKSSRNGCKVFACREKMQDKGGLAGRNPTHRLLLEVQKVGELYQEIQELILDYEVEIHLDLNPDECHKSSQAAKAALGYIRSFDDLGDHFVAKLKPESFAASHAADRLFRGKSGRKTRKFYRRRETA